MDPDTLFVSQLAAIVGASGYRCVALTEFLEARHELLLCRPHVLIASLRLAAFNGIHLAYLAKNNRPDTRVMIYGTNDRMLAAEIQSAGAFFERQSSVLVAVTAFLQGNLPDRDRRGVTVVDRRSVFRGGRRTTDMSVLHTAPIR